MPFEKNMKTSGELIGWITVLGYAVLCGLLWSSM